MSHCVSAVCQKPIAKKTAKISAIVWTTIYILLFPALVAKAPWLIMVFDSPSTSLLKGLSSIFIASFIPLSLPISIDLMWSTYVSGKYYWAMFSWLLPVAILIAIIGLEQIIRTLGLL
jgi:hypothetical protein